MSEPKPTDYYQGQSVSDFIALFALPWHLANVVKYIVRWWLKDDMAGLYKAKDYLDTFIGNCEADPTFKVATVAGIKATIEARRAAEVTPEQAPTKPPIEDEFDSLKLGDTIAIYDAVYKVAQKRGDDIVAVGEGKPEVISRAWYRNAWRKVPNAKPGDAAPAEPESDYGTLKEGDFFAAPGGKPHKVAEVDHDGVVWSEFLGGRMTIFEPDYIRYGYRKVAKS